MPKFPCSSAPYLNSSILWSVRRKSRSSQRRHAGLWLFRPQVGYHVSFRNGGAKITQVGLVWPFTYKTRACSVEAIIDPQNSSLIYTVAIKGYACLVYRALASLLCAIFLIDQDGREPLLFRLFNAPSRMKVLFIQNGATLRPWIDKAANGIPLLMERTLLLLSHYIHTRSERG